MPTGKISKADYPGFALFLSGMFFLLSAAQFYGGNLSYKDKHELYEVSGIIHSFEIEKSVRYGVNNVKILINKNGVLRHLTQENLSLSIPALTTLKPGDEVNALVAADGLGRNLEWVWELHREGEKLLSYEQTRGILYPAPQYNSLGIAALVVAIAFLVTAIVLRFRFGNWTS